MEVMATVVGGIAHEFSDILNNVLGFTSLVKKYIHDHGKVLKYSQAIEQSVKRGDEVAQRLRAFARLDKRALEPVKVCVSSTRWAEQYEVNVLNSFRYTEVRCRCPDILAVRNELVQAMMNLARNARTPSSGMRRPEIRHDHDRSGTVTGTDDTAAALMLLSAKHA